MLMYIFIVINLFLLGTLSSSNTVSEETIHILLDENFELECPQSEFELKYILFRRSIDNIDVTEINEQDLDKYFTNQELQEVPAVIESAKFSNSGRYFCIYTTTREKILIKSFLLAVSDTYVYERVAKLSEKLTLYITGFDSAELSEFVWIFNDEIITTQNSHFSIDEVTKDLTVTIEDQSFFGVYMFKNAKSGEFVLYEIKQKTDDQNRKAPLVQPYNLEVDAGTPVIFECFNRNLNEEPENYQWYKLDSKEKKTALDQAYLLENAHIKDENFSYSINITDLRNKYSAALIRNGKVLKIGNVSQSESGWYLCCLVYSDGYIYSNEEPTMKCSSSYLVVKNASDVDKALLGLFNKQKSSKASIFFAIATPTIIILILFSSIFAIMFLYKKLKTINNVQKGREFLHKNDLYMKKYKIGSSFSSTNTQVTPADNASVITCDLFKSESYNNSSETLHSFIQKYLADTNGSRWEIAFESLSFGRVLGMGAFGVVIYGEERNPVKNTIRSVAIKKLKNNESVANFNELVTELKLMSHVGEHQYIINLLGYTFDKLNNDLYIVTEFAKHGNLKEYLTKFYECDTKIKFNENYMPLYAYQIACGMEYLHSKEVLHRDLAARNILVSEDNLIKIADFGLARNIRSDYYYMKQADGRFPIKWMAPEALTHNKISKKSDTWSYGVLLWEIYTYGCAPYPLIQPEDILKYISSGHRLEKPNNCDAKIYEIMLRCWNMNVNERPDFTWLADQLNFYLHSNNDLSSLCDLLKIRNSSLSDCDETIVSNLNEKCNSTVSIINSSGSASFPSSTSSVGTLEIYYEHNKNFEQQSNQSFNKDDHELKPFLESFYTNSDNKQNLIYSESRNQPKATPLKEILASKLKLQSPLNLIRLHRSNQFV